MSPNGGTLVRIKTLKVAAEPKSLLKHQVSYYEFNAENDSFLRRSSFHLNGKLPEMLYVSNAGDLVFICLEKAEAIRLFSKNGEQKRWNLTDLLTEAEIQACAETGSTLQWLQEGEFVGRSFYFSGPSKRIRSLGAPFTVMRGVDEKVTFSASIDAETGELTKNEPEEPEDISEPNDAIETEDLESSEKSGEPENE